MYYSAEILKRKMFLPKHLAWVNVVFSGHPGWEDFANRGLLPDNVKALIEALESIHNDQSNLRDINPYKYLVSHNERPWDEVVKEMLLFFLLSNDAVREAMLAYFNALGDWQTYLETSQTSQVEVGEWNRGSDALQEKVNNAHNALYQVVANTLQSSLIHDFLTTAQNIVIDAGSAQVASLLPYNDQLTATMNQHRTTRDTLLQQLQLQLQAIEAEIIA
jgi:hypothetical protein